MSSGGFSNRLAMFEQATKANPQSPVAGIPKQPPYKAPKPPTASKPPAVALKPVVAAKKTAVAAPSGNPPPKKLPGSNKIEEESPPLVIRRPPGAKALAPVGINTLAQIKGGLKSPTRVTSDHFKDDYPGKKEVEPKENAEVSTADSENMPTRPPGRPPKSVNKPQDSKMPTRRAVELPKNVKKEKEPVIYEGKVLPETIELASGVVLRLQRFVPPTEPAPPPPHRPPHVFLVSGDGSVTNEDMYDECEVAPVMGAPPQRQDQDENDELYDEVMTVPPNTTQAIQPPAETGPIEPYDMNIHSSSFDDENYDDMLPPPPPALTGCSAVMPTDDDLYDDTIVDESGGPIMPTPEDIYEEVSASVIEDPENDYETIAELRAKAKALQV